MKIGLIIYGSLETVSGGYLYDRKLVAHLRKQGHTVEVISLPWVNYGRHLLHNFSNALVQQVQQANFDILLQDELNHPSLAWLNGRLRPHIHCPIITIVHHLRSSEQHPGWLMPLYRTVERRYLRSVDGFIFNSDTSRRVVKEMVGEERPFIVAPPAGDRFMPLAREEVLEKTAVSIPLRLLFVGNVTQRKGIDTLIKALPGLPEGKWQLDIVGSPEVEPTYAQHWTVTQPQQLGIAQQIAVHGKVSDAELEAIYRQAHLLVVPSQYEGFGIVYLEGMGFGCPAIGTTGGAAGELITHGENGFLIKVGETAVLQTHLLTLINTPALLQKMALAAYHRFHTHPTWQDSMAKIEFFLEKQRRDTETQRKKKNRNLRN